MDKEVKANLERFFIFPLKKYPFRIIIITFFVILLRIFNIDTSSTWDIFVLFFSIIFIMVLLFPIVIDLSFYEQYLMTQHNLSALRFSIENGGKNFNSNYNKFINNYNLFRDQLKNIVRKSKLNFLTRDQEIICLIQKIDVFFDATTKLIIKNEDFLTPAHLSEIDNFLKSLKNSMFRSPKSINILCIHELFNKFNDDIKKSDAKLFEVTRKNVAEYYKNRRLKNTLSVILYSFYNKI